MSVNANLPHILDLSQHNGKWRVPAKKKPDAVIARASIGLRKDANFKEYANVAAGEGIPFMAYHYFMSAYYWVSQMDLLLEVTDPCTKTNVRARFQDYETKGNVMSKAFAVNAVLGMRYLVSRTSEPVGLYSGRSVLAVMYQQAAGAKAFDLWFAQYWNKAVYDRTPNIQPKITPEFTTLDNLIIWQYGSEVNQFKDGEDYGIESESLDHNVWLAKRDMYEYLS